IHDWLVTYGGAERVVEAFLEMYPDADIYTLVYDEAKMGKIFKPAKVKTTFIQKFPKATKIYTKLLPFMPYAFEELDLSEYDLVISSSSCCSKGVITGPNTKHVSYVHSPMRYAWDLYHDYKKRSRKVTRFFMSIFMKSLREWDYTSSQRIDVIVANSNYVAKRINKFWNRECKVIYPPVDIDRLSANGKPSEDFYVVFSRFVPYKRIDLAILACKAMGRKLVVIGDGEQRDYLKSLGDSNITFTGRLSDDEVKDYLQRCRAMLFCAEEDFGIVPLEAQACGRPVIAYGRGGALETVVDSVTGVFFHKQEADSLIGGIKKFEKLNLNTEDILNHASKFCRERFKKEMDVIINDNN
ncbi:MAG: glycosyltransferase, partial [Cetobacterium sp.]